MVTLEEKKALIESLMQKHEISAYEIGKNTTISSTAVENIIDGTTENPRNKTLNIILEYLENRIVGTQINQEKTYKANSDTPALAMNEGIEAYEKSEESLETIIYKRIYTRFERKFTDIENRLTNLEAKN